MLSIQHGGDLGNGGKKIGSQVFKFFKWSCKQTSHDEGAAESLTRPDVFTIRWPARHAPPNPPTPFQPLQDLFSVSSAVETGADNFRRAPQKIWDRLSSPEQSSDKTRDEELSPGKIPVK